LILTLVSPSDPIKALAVGIRLVLALIGTFSCTFARATDGPWVDLYQFAPTEAHAPGNKIQLRYVTEIVLGRKYLRPEITLLKPSGERAAIPKLDTRRRFAKEMVHIVVNFGGSLQGGTSRATADAATELDPTPFGEEFVLRRAFMENAPSHWTFVSLAILPREDQLERPSPIENAFIVTDQGEVRPIDLNYLTNQSDELLFAGGVLRSQGGVPLNFLGLKVFARILHEQKKIEYFLIDDSGTTYPVAHAEMAPEATISDLMATLTMEPGGRNYAIQLHVLAAQSSKDAPMQSHHLVQISNDLQRLVRARTQTQREAMARNRLNALNKAAQNILTRGFYKKRIDLIEESIELTLDLKVLEAGLDLATSKNDRRLLAQLIARSAAWTDGRGVTFISSWMERLLMDAISNSLNMGTFEWGHPLAIDLLSAGVCSFIAEEPKGFRAGPFTKPKKKD
jgi:hypothetical protein